MRPGQGGSVDERLMYRREFFIGGGWAAPAGRRAARRRLAVDGGGRRRGPGGDHGGYRPRGRRGADGVRRRAVAAHGAGRAGRPSWPGPPTLLRKREAEIAGVTVDEMGCAISQRRRGPRPAWWPPLFDYYAELIRTFEFEREVVGGRPRRPGDQRAGRGGGRDRSLERPGHPGLLEGGARPGRRVHRGAQAPARGPAEQLHPGRGAGRGGRPARRRSTWCPAGARSASTW